MIMVLERCDRKRCDKKRYDRKRWDRKRIKGFCLNIKLFSFQEQFLCGNLQENID